MLGPHLGSFVKWSCDTLVEPHVFDGLSNGYFFIHFIGMFNQGSSSIWTTSAIGIFLILPRVGMEQGLYAYMSFLKMKSSCFSFSFCFSLTSSCGNVERLNEIAPKNLQILTESEKKFDDGAVPFSLYPALPPRRRRCGCSPHLPCPLTPHTSSARNSC